MIDPFTLALILIVALTLMGASVGLAMIAGSFVYLIFKGFDPSIASETLLQGLFNNYTLLAIPLSLMAAVVGHPRPAFASSRTKADIAG